MPGEWRVQGRGGGPLGFASGGPVPVGPKLASVRQTGSRQRSPTTGAGGGPTVATPNSTARHTGRTLGGPLPGKRKLQSETWLSGVMFVQSVTRGIPCMPYVSSRNTKESTLLRQRFALVYHLST